YLQSEKATYWVDYSEIKKRQKKDTFMIRVHDLPKGEYELFVKSQGEIYSIEDSEIRIEDK
ncbi:MAG: hypothetical protein K6G11_00755, partial [Lachnospiraceae bacterium]|nr:hypothetical protein [Lachnospiraceae bacterium]